MKIISLLNIKGGVAKTVSTVNIAAELGNSGKRVLVLDLDPQSNSTKYLDCYSHDNASMYELLRGEDNNYIKDTEYEGVFIVPANIRLILAEPEILSDTRKARETRLKKWVKTIDGQFDYVLIDCPPALGMLTTNALAASEYVLVPIKIDKFALDGFQYLLSSIEEAREEFNENLKFLGAFITMDKATNINKEIKSELRDALGTKFFNQTIRDNVEVVKSTFDSIPLAYCNPNANAAKDYKALVREIESCLI
ncbi:ParA family protein [Clostridium gasigenes]|uniref:ParA family protein n=1 Tax=Clostridium gasigenes TaxID=94869 RepID=UPI001623BB71|nr:ParA family protein [Clostridium gasigenes]MBB6622547.1 ParA family protein [Clostridium gasigenes]